MNSTSKNIIEAVETLLNSYNKKLRRDKTFKSTIWGVDESGLCKTYKISYMNQTYFVPNGLGIDLSLGQSVWVTMPSGVFKDMYISAINYKKNK